MPPGPVKAACDRGAAVSARVHGSYAREDRLDRTRPSPGPAAAGFGEGLGKAERGHVAAPAIVSEPTSLGILASSVSSRPSDWMRISAP